MKGRNIRKDKPKKPLRKPVNHDNKVLFTDTDKGLDYYLVQNNYETIVCLRETNEPVGIYRAATRSWKNPIQGLLTAKVMNKVYSLYP